jgi:hypothetical protein
MSFINSSTFGPSLLFSSFLQKTKGYTFFLKDDEPLQCREERDIYEMDNTSALYICITNLIMWKPE